MGPNRIMNDVEVNRFSSTFVVFSIGNISGDPRVVAHPPASNNVPCGFREFESIAGISGPGLLAAPHGQLPSHGGLWPDMLWRFTERFVDRLGKFAERLTERHRKPPSPAQCLGPGGLRGLSANSSAKLSSLSANLSGHKPAMCLP
jgi:hypothetical protein